MKMCFRPVLWMEVSNDISKNDTLLNKHSASTDQAIDTCFANNKFYSHHQRFDVSVSHLKTDMV